ncbi:MAG TPA: hypothetical protein VL996_14695 [Methylocella sp.]|nr:hypothetical protein [Methylocella sp.]
MGRLLAAVIAASTLMSPRLASGADYAPIDCSKASSPAQRAICQTYSLGQAEARMATLFGIATSLVAMGQRGDIGDAQRQWLKTREACGGKVACLTKAYDARIAQLNQVIDDIASRGPY